jgi:regulator of PEP synthase PpsR (kinase-PPPase family)
MPSFEVYMNILWLPVIVLLSAIIGFILRSAQLRKTRQKVFSLENEMLKNHAEILQLQKDIVRLQSIMGDSKTPVVNIKDSSSEEKTSAK